MSCDLVTEGYVPCACRDCFEIAIGVRGEALCNECEDAGCEASADQECSSEYAYGCSDDECEADNV